MAKHNSLTNSGIAELLAVEAESASMPAAKALRSASRRAFMWEDEAIDRLREERSLTELDKVGPYIEKLIRGWVGEANDRARTPRDT